MTELKVGLAAGQELALFRSRPDQEQARRPRKRAPFPNFGDVTKDIVSLNQWPDRRVTPALRAGVAPGTVDVDLNVEDKSPLHASLEVNNRQSPSTTPTPSQRHRAL